jgi:CRP/FNR family cyclic AMP-dependent transcriptional regulator
MRTGANKNCSQLHTNSFRDFPSEKTLVCNFAHPHPVFLGHSKNQRGSSATGVLHTMQTARKTTAVKSAKTRSALGNLLQDVAESKDLFKFQNGAKLFSQGEVGDAIYFIQTGKVQLIAVSAQGREAVLATLGPHDFLGEECLVGNSRRTSTATSLKLSTAFKIDKRSMLEALHLHPKFSREFVTSLLARNINLEEGLRDELFNHSERRLACTLLKLSRSGRRDKLPDAKLPKFTQQMLAEIIGTTRSKVSVLMNKFRKLGLIDYRGAGDITVKAELLTKVVLHD